MNINFPLVVIGAQWGDEGKGKIIDILSKEADYVVRFNGGNNAGHTVVVDGEKFPLSLLPSGVLQGKKLFIAQGVVIEPSVLLKEIDLFEKRGIKVRLTIDPRAHIVMPYHKELDRATELWKGKKAAGSLHLGIGYCYEDKNNRFGVRFEDLINPKLLREKLEMFIPLKKRQIELVFRQKTTLTVDAIYKEYVEYGRKLKKYLGDVSKIVQIALNNSYGSSLTGYSTVPVLSRTKIKNSSRLRSKNKVLFEGAHGTFLDGIFGTYPYTTAVYTISGSVFPYVGISPQKIYSLGVVKAYTTRVGNGPFPTELRNQTGDEIRKNGGEFGTVSKRPRRCGWFDLVLVRTAARLSRFDYLALTKLDVLSTFTTIRICTHYLINNYSSSKRSASRSSRQARTISEVPSLMTDFSKCRPIFVEFEGWKKDISHVKKFQDLPREAKIYIKFIEKNLKVPIYYIFVGPDREQTIENGY